MSSYVIQTNSSKTMQNPNAARWPGVGDHRQTFRPAISHGISRCEIPSQWSASNSSRNSVSTAGNVVNPGVRTSWRPPQQSAGHDFSVNRSAFPAVRQPVPNGLNYVRSTGSNGIQPNRFAPGSFGQTPSLSVRPFAQPNLPINRPFAPSSTQRFNQPINRYPSQISRGPVISQPNGISKVENVSSIQTQKSGGFVPQISYNFPPSQAFVPSTSVPASGPPLTQSDFPDDDDADLLTAMDEFDAYSQQTEVAVPPVEVKIEERSNEMDDDADLDWMLELDPTQPDGDQKNIVEDWPASAEMKFVHLEEQKGDDRLGVVQRVVVTSFEPGPFPAPHNAPPGLKQTYSRQATMSEFVQESANMLDSMPAGTQVPAGLVPLPGFDANAGLTWLYPTNCEVRDYQYNIVQKALFRNTLVVLPTGLGKTFIAAVVMYNFYRWYPKGKVVFMAPTKPLVSQQMRACYSIMGIPQTDMVEMTGSISPQQRAQLWTAKRLFFMTPQTAVNDLENDAFHAPDIKCLVVDEAHRASGAYAYCTIVRLISSQNTQFRILALSATPGHDPASVQNVLTNLLINHLEIRQDDSIDIRRYTHTRTIEKILVPLDPQIKHACDQLFGIILFYVDKLRRGGGIPSYMDNYKITAFGILNAQRDFQAKTNAQGYLKQSMMTYFMTAHGLLQSYELLQFYGFRPFYTHVHSAFRAKKASNGLAAHELRKNPDFDRLVNFVKGILEEDLSVLGVDGLMDTSAINPDRPYIYGHPKLRKLEEIVLEHFQAPSDAPSTSRGAARDSRIMIFTSYRNSVQEITSMLRRHDPLIRVMKFIGQSCVSSKRKGLTQKEQTEVLSKFRDGNYNVLVSTSVGEEGLDIGEVDLIVCFDAQKSPLRSIQRTGRTGRKRQGKSIMLLTEGNEEEKYRKCVSNKGSVQKILLRPDYQFYAANPRMVPDALRPVCVKLKVDMPPYDEALENGLGGKKKKSSKGEFAAWITKKPTVKQTAKYEHDFLTDDELTEYGRYCKAPSSDVAVDAPNEDEPAKSRFLFNPLNFAELCRTFRNRETMEPAASTSPLSVSNYPAFQVLQQNSALSHSVKSANFVAAMTQLSELSMAFDGNQACDADLVKLYHKAARAGYIDLEGVPAEPQSSSSEDQSSMEPTPVIKLFNPIRKKPARVRRLSTLSTPTPEELDDSHEISPPPNGEEKTGLVEIAEGWEDEAAEADSEDDEEVVSRHSKSLRRTFPDSSDEEDQDEPSNKDEGNLNHDVSGFVGDGIEEDIPVEDYENNYSDFQLDTWETWSDEMAPVDPAGAQLPVANHGMLADVTAYPGEAPDSEASMLSINAAASFVNRTDVVLETPLADMKTRRKTLGSVVRSGVLDFGDEDDNEMPWSTEPFNHRNGQPEARNSVFVPIDDSLPLVPGPSGHSTPTGKQTSRKRLTGCDVSRIADPASSPSYIPASDVDEDEENEIPCSIPDEAEFDANGLAGRNADFQDEEMDDFASTGPFLPHPAEVRPNGPVDTSHAVASSAPALVRAEIIPEEPKFMISFRPGQSRRSHDNCRTPADDSEERMVFRRRRKRPVAAFETPPTGPAESVRRPVHESNIAGSSPKRKPAQNAISRPARRGQKAPLVFVQEPKKSNNVRMKALDFLDDEAAVSGEENCSADESEEDETDPDNYPSGLLASQSVAEDPTYMQAIYAQHNMYSPPTDEVMRRLGPREFRNTNIFSQEFVQDADYGPSSFIAYSEEEDTEEEESPLVVRKKRPAVAVPMKKDQPARPAKGWNHDFRSPRQNLPKK